MVPYDKWLCWFRFIWNDAPLKAAVLVQSSFHANNLTENEYVTANSAQNCYVIARDWLTMLAEEDTADPSSIPALCHRRQNSHKSFKFLYFLVTRLFWKNCYHFFFCWSSSKFLGKINLFIFNYPKQKVIVANDLEWTWSSNKHFAFRTCLFL